MKSQMMSGGAVGPEGVQLQALHLLSLDESAQLPLWAQKVHYMSLVAHVVVPIILMLAVCRGVRACWAVE